MGVTRTTESFVLSATKVHNGKYGYAETVYNGSKNNVIVTCSIHGNFNIQAGNHLSGKGCLKCARSIIEASRRDTKESFICKAKLIHGEKFDYSLVDYINDSTNVRIVCKEHGEFLSTPSNHKKGRNCPCCSNINRRISQADSFQDFINKAKEVHGFKYDYSLIGRSDYIGNKNKVNIVCKEHGIFRQTPENHKSGSGCPVCQPGGYNKQLNGVFYILTSGLIVKVGITNKSAVHRAAQVSRNSGINFSVYCSITGEGEFIQEIEKHILSWLRLRYSTVQEKYNGSTECFVNVDINELSAIVEAFIHNFNVETELS